MARIIRVSSGKESDRGIELGAEVLLKGGAVVFPTESFYGLGVNALDEKALQRLFRIKGRREGHPVLILIPSVDVLERYVARVPPLARRLMERFWPGGLTLVLEARHGLSPLLTGGTGKIGIRLSSHPVPTRLAAEVGTAITGTSANPTGSPACRSAREVMETLGEEVDLILDGGRTPGGKGSTVLDVTVHPPRFIREGMVEKEILEPHLAACPSITFASF